MKTIIIILFLLFSISCFAQPVWIKTNTVQKHTPLGQVLSKYKEYVDSCYNGKFYYLWIGDAGWTVYTMEQAQEIVRVHNVWANVRIDVRKEQPTFDGYMRWLNMNFPDDKRKK